MQVALLVNAAAGRGRATGARGPVRAALAAAGLEVHELVATDRSAAEAAVRTVTGAVAAVVVLGGDGAAHAAVQGLAGTDTPLAVLPAGTGDDLALALGVPADPVEAARAAGTDLVAGRSARVDLGRTSTSDGDRWWATVLCCGFDTAWPGGSRSRWSPSATPPGTAVGCGCARPPTPRTGCWTSPSSAR
ncbi:MAG: Diacylglycerol kinase [Klenkia sp.]|nr:Diacylglycerol kinase [Klenkia sp.]